MDNRPYIMLVEIIPDNSAYVSDLGARLNMTTPITGVAYSGAVEGTEGIPPYTYSMPAGVLPTGLTLNADGTITGTTTDQTYRPVTFRVTDSALTQVDVTAALQAVAPLVLSIDLSPFEKIQNSPPPIGYVDQRQYIVASGGTPPYTYSVTPALPLGFITGASGSSYYIATTGLPVGLVAQTTLHRFQVTDSAGQVTYADRAVVVRPEMAAIAAPSSTADAQGEHYVAIQNQFFDITFGRVEGVAPIWWTVEDITVGATLPSGLQLDPVLGRVYGVPTAAPGNYYCGYAWLHDKWSTHTPAAYPSHAVVRFYIKVVAQPVRPSNVTSIDFGDAVATTFTLTHSIGAVDVVVEVYENASGRTVEVDVERLSATQIRISGFLTPPAAGQYKAVIEG